MPREAPRAWHACTVIWRNSAYARCLSDVIWVCCLPCRSSCQTLSVARRRRINRLRRRMYNKFLDAPSVMTMSQRGIWLKASEVDIAISFWYISCAENARYSRQKTAMANHLLALRCMSYHAKSAGIVNAGSVNHSMKYRLSSHDEIKWRRAIILHLLSQIGEAYPRRLRKVYAVVVSIKESEVKLIIMSWRRQWQLVDIGLITI